MKRTNIYLDEVQKAGLEQLAAQQGISTAELIRRLLDRALNSTDDNLEADLAAIEGSFGAFAALEPADRGPGGREEHLDRMWRRSP